jgi:predicted MFS family arabinose efflux permease
MVRLVRHQSTRGIRPRVLVLAFGTFAVGTDAFVVAGLLHDIGTSLAITVGQAGQVITVFALTYAVLSPLLATLTARWPRRSLLVLALCVFAVGNILTAAAGSYVLLMLSRVVAAAGAAMVTPNSSVTAAALVPDRQRARAISVAVSGLTISTALGSPLGTAIGAQVGWRAVMVMVAGLGALAAAAIALILPPVPGGGPAPLLYRLRVNARPEILLVLTTTLISFTAVYVVYSYSSAIFAPTTRGSGPHLAAVLLAFGIGAVAGNIVAGIAADRYGAARVVNAAIVVLTAGCAVLPVARFGLGYSAVTAAVIGAASFSLTSPQQHRLISRRPDESAVVVSVSACFTYLAVAVAGGLGGILLTVAGIEYLPVLAVGFGIAGLMFSLLAERHTGYGPHHRSPARRI